MKITVVGVGYVGLSLAVLWHSWDKPNRASTKEGTAKCQISSHPAIDTKE